LYNPLCRLISRPLQHSPRLSQPCCVLHTPLPCPGSARGGHFSKGLTGYNIGNVQQFLKKYLQCILAARILTVDFVVCTLAVEKKIRAGFDMSDRTIPL
jgi:hypothetical protein